MAAQGLFSAAVEYIDTKAVLLEVHYFHEPGFELFQLGWAYTALEKRELHPLAKVLADSCYLAQPPLAVLAHCLYVVGDDYVQTLHLTCS